MDERVKKLFKDESNELYKKVLDRILDFVRDNEIVKISDYNLSLDDVIKRLNEMFKINSKKVSEEERLGYINIYYITDLDKFFESL